MASLFVVFFISPSNGKIIARFYFDKTTNMASLFVFFFMSPFIGKIIARVDFNKEGKLENPAGEKCDSGSAQMQTQRWGIYNTG